jgi:hypothetical protein
MSTRIITDSNGRKHITNEPLLHQPAPVPQKPYAYANPDDLSADTAFRWCEINEYTMPVYTTPPAAQHQCKWPTCQSEEYQQALAEQIKQELVTGAAQRQWVGLTEQEAAECWSTSTVRTWQAIEAKLKEKNNGY